MRHLGSFGFCTWAQEPPAPSSAACAPRAPAGRTLWGCASYQAARVSATLEEAAERRLASTSAPAPRRKRRAIPLPVCVKSRALPVLRRRTPPGPSAGSAPAAVGCLGPALRAVAPACAAMALGVVLDRFASPVSALPGKPVIRAPADARRSPRLLPRPLLPLLPRPPRPRRRHRP